jgi:homoserine O-acetyltransferase
MNYFTYDAPFALEGGASLPGITIAYHTYGRLNEDRSNVVWVCHALTANSDAGHWWPGVVGEHGAVSPDNYFIVCANILGSCYGSTGPVSVDSRTGAPYFSHFPQVTIRDMVRAHILLRQHLGIDKIHLLMGGSMGGYQALEWAVMEKEVIRQLFLIATSPAESAWGIAVHTAQRLAIEADPSWRDEREDAGDQGYGQPSAGEGEGKDPRRSVERHSAKDPADRYYQRYSLPDGRAAAYGGSPAECPAGGDRLRVWARWLYGGGRDDSHPLT